MTNQWQHNEWANFGDVSTEHGQTWILDATVDSEQDYAECVKIWGVSNAFGGPDNVYVIERGSIYMPLDDSEKVSCALGCSGFTPSLATWIDKALAFETYHGMDRDIYNGLEIVAVGKVTDQDGLDAMPHGWEIETQLHGNASIDKYLRDNFLT
mgnify:CR=1 FL=1|tara:strand:- start:170 stop:631 length:462 start_codon:yes stop_codon:yes gene_type:complete